MATEERPLAGDAAVVWRSEKITVCWEPQLAAIVHTVHKYCYGDAFRDALAAGVEAMALHGAVAWMSDDRNNGPVSPDDDEWINAVWFPRARACGWQRWAVVTPVAVVGQLNVARTVKLFAGLGVQVEWFDAPDAARAWLAGFMTR